MRPGSVVVVRDNRMIEQPNLTLRGFRTDAAAAIQRAGLDTEETRVIWALVLAAEGWTDVAAWARSRLGVR